MEKSVENLFKKYAVLLSSGITLEALAGPKPGNVHRYSCHRDKCVEDYVLAGLVGLLVVYDGIRRGFSMKTTRGSWIHDMLYMDLARELVLGSMRISGAGNLCLGEAVMLLPLSIAVGYLLGDGERPDANVVASTATRLVRDYSTPLDTIVYYEILRSIKPSYLREQDDTGEYPNIYDHKYREKILEKEITLWELLRYSSRIDIIAREVTGNYKLSVETSFFLEDRFREHNDWNRAVIEAFLYVLSSVRDTVVKLRYGNEVADKIMRRAGSILDTLMYDYDTGMKELGVFDKELRRENINPGASADITGIAISLFAIRKKERMLRMP